MSSTKGKKRLQPGVGFQWWRVPERQGVVIPATNKMCLTEEFLGLKCKSCGDVVDPRRVELGYDYCLKETCQQRCLKRVPLAAVGINKAADYYTRADEVLSPPRPASIPVGGDEDPPAEVRSRLPVSKKEPRLPTTMVRLRRSEAQLDQDLERSFERFQRGEITAGEMDRECDDLTAAFNRQVLSENIRYRSMQRPRRLQRA